MEEFLWISAATAGYDGKCSVGAAVAASEVSRMVEVAQFLIFLLKHYYSWLYQQWDPINFQLHVYCCIEDSDRDDLYQTCTFCFLLVVLQNNWKEIAPRCLAGVCTHSQTCLVIRSYWPIHLLTLIKDGLYGLVCYQILKELPIFHQSFGHSSGAACI